MKFISLKTNVVFLVILALLGVILFREREMRKKEDAAVALVEVSAIRAGLSVYFAERGSYPKMEKTAIGGSASRVLCLSRNLGEEEGFLKDGVSCSGSVVYKSSTLPETPFFYTSSGASYSVQFAVSSSLGAFTSAGAYCATEKGVLVGECG